MKFHKSKKELFDNVECVPLKSMVCARDTNAMGSKEYCCKSAVDFAAFINTHKTSDIHLHEVIPNISCHPCYIFFDLDRWVTSNEFTAITQNEIEYINTYVANFESIFQGFVQTVYACSVKLERGINYQAWYTPSLPHAQKVSIHLKINIVMDNIASLRELVINFDKYMSSNLYVGNEDRQWFFYYREGVFTPVLDVSVYSNFRCYRTLFSSKPSTTTSLTSNPSIPCPGFSTKAEDHFVLVYENIPQTLINVSLNSHAAITINADFSKKHHVSFDASLMPVPVDNGCDNKHAEMALALINTMGHVIRHSKELHELFDTTYLNFSNQSSFLTASIYMFVLDKRCSCKCPYAGRVHKSNNSRLDYHIRDNVLKFKCMDDACHLQQQRECIVIRINKEGDTLARLCSLSSPHTLHSKQNIIDWDEVYDAPQMKSYPICALACIRGNMGASKTHVLISDFIRQHCAHPNTKCLFITYKQLLANKYHFELRDHDFVNYQDQTGSILANKVVVCLDSLWRVKNMNFDYIFLDEALSVLLHFNSSLMGKKVTTISTVFELMLLQCAHIYILDACADNTLVYDFVTYLARTKNIKPYWIWNKHVRPTNRICTAMVNTNRSVKAEASIKVAAFEKISSLILMGKTIVVSSSTKAFTEQLGAHIQQKCPEHVRHIVYNCDTNRETLLAHASNPNKEWVNYDVLIYSPTIGAGLSFETLHFDVAVCYLENSHYTPTIDFVLQQMFRVRQLKEGDMFLYINDTVKVDHSNHPVMEDQVEKWLDENVTVLHQYIKSENVHFDSPCNVVVDKEGSCGILYDRSRLSYCILKGIIANKNLSLLNFTSTLLHTLRSDYNIPCDYMTHQPTKDMILNSLEVFKDVKMSSHAVNTPFEDSLLVCTAAYQSIQEKIRCGTHVSDRERLQAWIYKAAIELWGINIQDVDEAFFNNYIGQCNAKAMRRAYATYYKIHRLKDAMVKTLDENKQDMALAMMRLKTTPDDSKLADFNIELYKTHTTEYYEKLIEGKKLMQLVLGSDVISELQYRAPGKACIKTSVLDAGFAVYASGLDADSFSRLQKVYGLNRSTFASLYKLRCNQRTWHAFIKTILAESFGMELHIESRNAHGCQIRSISIEWAHHLVDYYHPRQLHIRHRMGTHCCMTKEDDDC